MRKKTKAFLNRNACICLKTNYYKQSKNPSYLSESLYSQSVRGLHEGFFFLLKGIIPTITITYYVIMFKLDVFCILPVLLLHSVTKICASGPSENEKR